MHNQYPLPLILDLIHDLSNAISIQNLMSDGGITMSVFVKEMNTKQLSKHYGLFKPTVMYFGLTNSPATFQTMMNYIYCNTILKHKPQGTTIWTILVSQHGLT